MLALYENIRKRREELGLSQQELANLLGYKSRSTIAKIESGENDIPQSKIISFAKALKTTPEVLMGWNNNYFSSNITYFMQLNRLSFAEMSDKLKSIDTKRLIALIKQEDRPTQDELAEISNVINISSDKLVKEKMTSFKYHNDEMGNDAISDLDVIEINFGYGIRSIVERCNDLNLNGINKVLNYIDDLNDMYFK